MASVKAQSFEVTGDAKTTVNSISVSWLAVAAPDASVEDLREQSFIATLSQAGRNASCVVQRLTMDASAGKNGRLQCAGYFDFHFLCTGAQYLFTLKLEGGGDRPLLQLKLQTRSLAGRGIIGMLARALPADMWTTYVCEEDQLGHWLADCPEDMVWTTSPSSYEMMMSLWTNACFTLPSPGSPIMQCPNPRSRYCLDLTKGCPWLRSKKVKRHKGDFSLTVNADYVKTFNECERIHTISGKGTWITPELVSALDRCRREDTGEMKVYSLELWEKSTGSLAAAIMALSVGDIFHDYTTATMLRDSRSAGAILTKVVGHLLAECGFTLWYWGFKNPYMAEYDGQYGGVSLDSKQEFWPRWQRARAGVTADGQPHPPPQSLVELVRSKVEAGSGSGGKLDLACLT